MSSMWTLSTIVIYLSVQFSGACFTSGKTWSHLEAEVIDTLVGVETLHDCQKECINSTIGKCSHFTWYSDTDESPYYGLCSLFEYVPDQTEDCITCISSPVSCLTCGQPYICQTDSSTIIDVSPASLETDCQARCVDQEDCEFYTWYNRFNPVFGNECFLLNGCKRGAPCQDCLTGPRECHTNGGGVVLMGGVVNGNISRSVELVGDCAASTEDLPLAVEEGAAAMRDGSTFHCGGYYESDLKFDQTRSCYVKEESGVWREGPEMNIQRSEFTLNLVGNKLVAIGGYFRHSFEEGYFLNSVEVLESSEWHIVGNIPRARSSHCALTISDSSVLLIGGDGYAGTDFFRTTEELDINSGTVTPYADLPLGLRAPSCVIYSEMVILSGGFISHYGKTQSSVYSLDYRTEGSKWVLLNHLQHARRSHTMHVVNGVVTVYGGYSTAEDIHTLEELVDFQWVARPMNNQRFLHTSVLC